MTLAQPLQVEALAQRIYRIRGQRVLLDADLAELYGVPTKRLNEQIKRNPDRFPPDFLFQLSEEEHAALRSQLATSNTGRGGRRYLPYAFTEHGAIMAATVLNSPRAIEMSVFVVRAFVRLREMLSTHQELAEKLDALERTVSTHDQAIAGLINAIRELTHTPASRTRPIGFTADLDGGQK
ncbi:ORF6N domain-containing protein [Acidithiobacillus sp.]|uniref:ORF6N domain-containing protein n=1 Tax=Acidithiobacillus sp. TaxID=1872118 RepID=UPI003D04BE73